MQQELEVMQPELKVAALETEKMLEVIEIEADEVQIASELVKQDEMVANEQAACATALKNECEAELALAIPIFNGK